MLNARRMLLMFSINHYYLSGKIELMKYFSHNKKFRGNADGIEELSMIGCMDNIKKITFTQISL